MSTVELHINNQFFDAEISLPFSKSESNRLLILQALSEGKLHLNNLSDANDTYVLLRALASEKLNIDIEDAGTAARFITAFSCVANKHKIITGNSRMQERPIYPLFNALQQLGFRIQYLKREGVLPIEILPVNKANIGSEVSISGKISSQFISALILIGWKLPQGITIHIQDECTSFPYILLTQNLMEQCGLKATVTAMKIIIPPQKIDAKTISVRADWTNASYWYSFVALSENGTITLSDLDFESKQGDIVIMEIGDRLGVKTTLFNEKIVLTRKAVPANENLHFDFKNNPDLAQTIIVLCAARNIKATFSGLQTLRVKETDRIKALQNELQKFGVQLVENSNHLYVLDGSFKFTEETTIRTYNDHRMAMAFAPLALINKLIIDNPDVVNKSYPTFWEEVKKIQG